MLGVGGYVGYGRCEPRIEGIVQCTIKSLQASMIPCHEKLIQYN